MKTYRRAVLVIAAVLGLLALWIMASFTTLNACAFANQHTEFIKDQTQLAIKADNFEKAKYYAYKALRGINNTKKNFKDCGCENALKNITEAEKNLKVATKSKSFEDSKTFLEIAMKNTLNSIEALEEFENNDQSEYGDDLLVLNTKQVLNDQGGVLLSKAKQLRETMNQSLAEFENSLDKVIQYVDCPDAFNFISKIHTKTKEQLRKGSHSEAKIYYHKRVKEITYDALTRLNGCPVK
ncbi:hypothetical protein [Croceitalea rosinachiae]|uniref:DUF4398 domain-containing protein n=1 Tax=Croceitalea rosinachiae TaxID=3075596 RepID=A0ABU3AF80_9FLAO|nr:hypothetical protein [Croceitalea sp. F388]MDT0608207.1 hypothetical protein [Croceitalea sp. F388]